MGINLLEILGDQVTGELAEKAAGFLGGDTAGITKGLGAAFPAILGSVMDKGSTASGAGMLMDMIKGQDAGFMDNIGGLFSGGGDAANSLMSSGGGILDMLMGNKVGGIISMISKISGLGDGITGKLLKMAAPFLIGTIGKQVMKNGLNAGGLMDLLGGQKDFLAAAMPSGMGDLLGLGGLLKGVGNMVGGAADMGKSAVGGAANLGKSAVGAAASVGSAAVDTTKKAGSGLMKWLLPLLLVLGALYYFFGMSPKDVVNKAVDTTKNVANKTVDVAKDAANATANGVKTVGNAAGNAAGAVVGAFGDLFSKVDAAAKKALDAMKFNTGSAADQFNKFIAGGAKGNGIFRFKNLNFATGSATIDRESGIEVDNIAAIMKAYPNVKVEIAGHTDKTGNADANMKLSQARAAAVKGRLIAKGINPARLSAKGYASTQPVSASSTNAENRRIEVRIVK